jgi:hypothetical protein
MASREIERPTPELGIPEFVWLPGAKSKHQRFHGKAKVALLKRTGHLLHLGAVSGPDHGSDTCLNRHKLSVAI